MRFFKNTEKCLVVISAITKWCEPPRMRHYIAQELSKNYNVLFCELNQKGVSKYYRHSDSIVVFSPGGYISGIRRFSLTDKIFDHFQVLKINSFVRKITSKKVVLLNFRYDFEKIMSSTLFQQTYLFLNDDFISMEKKKDQPKKREILVNVVKKANRVFVSGPLLSSDIDNFNKNISVIYSGHDFKRIQPNVSSKKEPIKVCFMGYLHFRIEFNWIKSLAKSNFFEISFIGPFESPETEKYFSNYFSNFNNVFFFPPKTGRDLQKFMMDYDVFIMPYSKHDVNSKCSVPAKFFQYLACGKPIVSSTNVDLPVLPNKFVYKARNSTEFIKMIRLAVKEDDQRSSLKRIDYSMKNTWSIRGNEIRKIIANDIDR